MSDKETNGHASKRDDNANVRVAFDDVKSQYFLTIRLMAPLVGLIQTGTSTSAYILNATQFRGVLYTRLATMGDWAIRSPRKRWQEMPLIREMEVEIFLNIRTAKNLYDWLGQRFGEFEIIGDIIKEGTES